MGRLLDEDIVIDVLIGISGSKSIEELTEECEVYQSDNRCWSGGVYGAIRAIKELPPAQPEPQEGHWINGKCDRCGEHAPFWCMASTYHESNYCPNCGAKMTISTK